MAIRRYLFPDSVTKRSHYIYCKSFHGRGNVILCHWCSDLLWRAFSRCTQITGSAPGLRIPATLTPVESFSHSTKGFMYSKMSSSLCYRGHEAPVVSVSLGVVVAIFACCQQDSPKFGTRHLNSFRHKLSH